MKSPSEKNAARMIAPLAAVLAITAIVFSPSLYNQFTNWDDPAYILHNPLLSGSDLKSLWGSFYFSNYHPFTLFTYLLEYKTWGLNPLPYHASNVGLHLVNTALVFIFIYLLSKKNIAAASIASLFFGIHPLHMESVAWVSERKDVLYAMFFILGLISYYFYITRRKTRIQYFFVLVLFLFSLLSKAATVVFPLVMLLMDYYEGRKINRNALLEKIPFFLLSLLFGILAVKAQSEKAFAEHGLFTWWQPFVFAAYTFFAYIVKFFVPGNLAAFHPYPPFYNTSLPFIFYLAPPAFLLLLWAAYVSLKRTKIVFFGLMFFLFTIGLTLQFIPVGSAMMAERYTYIPYIGLLFIIGMGYAHLETKNSGIFSTLKYFSWCLLLIAAVYFSRASFERCRVWKDSETLWTDQIKKYPKSEVAYKNRAGYYSEVKKFDLAMKDCNSFLALKQDDAEVYSNRGTLHSLFQNYKEAVTDFSRSIELDPSRIKVYCSRGMALHELKEYALAMNDYEKALAMDSLLPEVYNNIGFTHLSMANYEKAIFNFNKALSMNPGLFASYNNRGYAKLMLYDVQAALQDINESIRLNSYNAYAFRNRALAYLQLADSQKVCIDISLALSLSPEGQLAAELKELMEKHCR